MCLSPREDTGIQSQTRAAPCPPPATGSPLAEVCIRGALCCPVGGGLHWERSWAQDPRGGGHGAKASALGDPVSAALHGDQAPCCRVLWGATAPGARRDGWAGP